MQQNFLTVFFFTSTGHHCYFEHSDSFYFLLNKTHSHSYDSPSRSYDSLSRSYDSPSHSYDSPSHSTLPLVLFKTDIVSTLFLVFLMIRQFFTLLPVILTTPLFFTLDPHSLYHSPMSPNSLINRPNRLIFCRHFVG